MAGSSSTFQSLQNWHDTDMYFIHVHNIGQIIGSMADLKTFFKIIHKLSLSRNIHAGDIMGSWDFVNQGKMYILHNLSLYRKIHAADLPMGYSIWNAILSRSTSFKLRRERGLGQATMSWNGVCASCQAFGVSGESLCLWELGQAARGAKERAGRDYIGNQASN